jgi:hypothetical protein
VNERPFMVNRGGVKGARCVKVAVRFRSDVRHELGVGETIRKASPVIRGILTGTVKLVERSENVGLYCMSDGKQ